MKALFFSPYLDILGGGELYTLSWAKYLSQKGYQITLAWNGQEILEKIRKRFGLDLEKAVVNPSLYAFFKQKTSLGEKYRFTRDFDLIFYLSDGSVPFLFAKKNIIHFQVPFTKRPDTGLINFLKFKLISSVVCNSYFTKSFIDKTYGVNSVVVHPFVQDDFKPGKRSNMILSVGRFDKTINQKKQEVLIKAFSSLSQKAKNWQLVLVGSSQDKKRIEDLKKQSRGLPVKILPNLAFEKLVSLYSQAEIFWLATGFSEDLEREPEKAEHFGIVVLEAMASGVVPVVYNGGGLPEIVEDRKNGFLFNNLSQLNEITLRLIHSEKERQGLAKVAIKRAQHFSQKNFYKKIERLTYCPEALPRGSPTESRCSRLVESRRTSTSSRD